MWLLEPAVTGAMVYCGPKLPPVTPVLVAAVVEKFCLDVDAKARMLLAPATESLLADVTVILAGAVAVAFS